MVEWMASIGKKNLGKPERNLKKLLVIVCMYRNGSFPNLVTSTSLSNHEIWFYIVKLQEIFHFDTLVRSKKLRLNYIKTNFALQRGFGLPWSRKQLYLMSTYDNYRFPWVSLRFCEVFFPIDGYSLSLRIESSHLMQKRELQDRCKDFCTLGPFA